ncbi:MAG: polysaccharide deacetylase family protein [Rhodoblastus sp.]
MRYSAVAVLLAGVLLGATVVAQTATDDPETAASPPAPAAPKARPKPPAAAPKPPARAAVPAQPIAKGECGNPELLNTSRQLAVDTRGGLHIGQKSYPNTLALADKEVILTFDDGPLPGPTDRVLAALEAECVSATFFLIGKNAQAHPQLTRRIAELGHTLGHHSWSHPVRTLRGLSPAAAIEEIRRGIDADQTAAYQTPWTGGPPVTPFFRFPGFADTPQTKAWLDAHDIAVFGTDLWASDWAMMTPEAQLKLVMSRLEETRGGIVLFHDTREQTARMLPAFLRRLKQEGYRVVHIVPRGAGNRLKAAPAGWSSETEEILKRVMPRLLKTPPAGERAPAMPDMDG